MATEKQKPSEGGGEGAESASKKLDFSDPAFLESAELKGPQAVATFMALETTQNLEFSFKLRAGVVTVQEANVYLAASTRLVESQSTSPKKMERTAILRAADMVRATNGDRELFRDMAQGYFSNQLKQAQQTAYFLITRDAAALSDPNVNTEEKFLEIAKELPPNYLELDIASQLKVASTLAKKYNFQIAPEEMRAAFLRVELVTREVAQTMQIFESDAAADAFIASVQAGQSPDEAFQEALKHCSKHLRAQYEKHVKKTREKNVADVQPPRVEGARVTAASETKSRAAVRLIQRSGVTLHMGDAGRGEMHFGGLARPVSIYAVDGEPKLFIYDANSDSGVRGPIDPDSAAVHAALRQVIVDLHFSHEFRRYVTSETEKDPNKVLDEKLFRITHALAPSVERNAGTELGALERRLVANIAHLCVEGDQKYSTLQDRVRFFERITFDPSRTDSARRFLTTLDLRDPAKKYSLSDFEQGLKEHIHPAA